MNPLLLLLENQCKISVHIMLELDLWKQFYANVGFIGNTSVGIDFNLSWCQMSKDCFDQRWRCSWNLPKLRWFKDANSNRSYRGLNNLLCLTACFLEISLNLSGSLKENLNSIFRQNSMKIVHETTSFKLGCLRNHFLIL